MFIFKHKSIIVEGNEGYQKCTEDYDKTIKKVKNLEKGSALKENIEKII